jgi:hypothetical protein
MGGGDMGILMVLCTLSECDGQSLPTPVSYLCLCHEHTVCAVLMSLDTNPKIVYK